MYAVRAAQERKHLQRRGHSFVSCMKVSSHKWLGNSNYILSKDGFALKVERTVLCDLESIEWEASWSKGLVIIGKQEKLKDWASGKRKLSAQEINSSICLGLLDLSVGYQLFLIFYFPSIISSPLPWLSSLYGCALVFFLSRFLYVQFLFYRTSVCRSFILVLKFVLGQTSSFWTFTILCIFQLSCFLYSSYRECHCNLEHLLLLLIKSEVEYRHMEGYLLCEESNSYIISSQWKKI